MGKPRNKIAVDAHFRNSAGAMKHKNTPRGGASNESADLLNEAEEEMKLAGTPVWASRDKRNSDNIKIWDTEPNYLEQNECFVGRCYLGISCVKKWPGPKMEPGEKRQVIAIFTDP